MTEEEFWSQPSKFTPQSRVEAHRFMEEKRKEKEETKKTDFPDLRNPLKRTIRFFNDEGRPLNINQDKMDFEFHENDDFTGYVLDVACYKHLGELNNSSIFIFARLLSKLKILNNNS